MASGTPVREFTAQELADVLRVSLRLGVMMLRSGTSSYRTDQAMMRLAHGLGVDRIENYITPTGIISSVYAGREHRTQLARIHTLGVDMNRVIELELLSRKLPEDADWRYVNDALDRIERLESQYSRLTITVMVAVACGALAVILHGGPIEFMAAALGSGIAQWIRFRLLDMHVRPIPVTVSCAFLATLISYAFLQLAGPRLLPIILGLGFNLASPRAGVVASVLLLVPGVPLVTSFLDIVRFDLVSGSARGLYAVVLLICVALGMILVLTWAGFGILELPR